jgi:hypothetical protein
MSRRGALGIAVAAAALASFAGAPRDARADTWSDVGNPAPTNPEMNARTTRAGFVLGFDLGYGVAATSGYPASASALGDPTKYSSSGPMAGGSSTIFVMGALADYANVGFWFGGGSQQSEHWRATSGGGGLRVDLFPLFDLAPRWKDLGVGLQFGIASASLKPKDPASPIPEAKGTSSLAGIGAFYEWTIFHALGGHTVLGPSAQLDYVWSQTISHPSFTLGARMVFYGGF